MIAQNRWLTPRVILQFIFVIVLMPLLPMIVAWRWDWPEAWLYALISLLGFVGSRALARRRSPGLLEERARFTEHTDAAGWDKTLAPLVVLGSLIIPLTAGLDERFGWPPAFSLGVRLAGLILLLAGYALATYALVENRFFSGVVRIQTDRGHQVVSSGPYAWMRHPGYAGGLVTYLATPLLLDSAWAFLPAVLISALLILRTALEDRMLQAQLPGYTEYARRVRYRLLPGVW